jgi:hypothetical protein
MCNHDGQLTLSNEHVPTAMIIPPVVSERSEAALTGLLIDRAIRILADGPKESGLRFPVLSITCVALRHSAAMPRCLGCWR